MPGPQNQRPFDINPPRPVVPINTSRGLPLVGKTQQAAAQAAWLRARQGNVSGFDRSRLTDVTPGEDGKLDANELKLLFLFEGTGMVGSEYLIDPATGTPSTTDQRLAYGIPKDYRFGKKTPQSQGVGALRNSTKNARLLQGLTIDQAIGFLVGLNDDELTKLQLQMVDAGMYGEDKPTLGLMDQNTTKAFSNMMRYLVQNPELTVGEALDNAVRGHSSDLQGMLEKKLGDSESEKRQQLKLLQPELTDAGTLSEMIDQISGDILGTKLTDGRKQEIVDQLRAGQYNDFMQTTYKQAEIDIANARPMDQMGTGSDVDLFMNAIMGQESGGDPNVVNSDSGAQGLFQIMPSNWVPWAREAGADPADHSAANQIKIAKYQMLKYYQTFGNWRDVAVAWYAGPGSVNQRYSTADQDGYPSINEYAQQAMNRFTAAKGGLGATGYKDPLLQVSPKDAYNVSSEARKAIIAGNSQDYAGHEFQKQAKSFMDLLAGVL